MIQLTSVQAVICDVDGVLTSGRKYYSETGENLIDFNVKDGIASKMLSLMRIPLFIITASSSEAIKRRSNDIEFTELGLGVVDKAAHAVELFRRHNMDPINVAAICDDLPDLELMRLVGVPAAPIDAAEEVIQTASIKLRTIAGGGVLREFVNLLSLARGITWHDYPTPRSTLSGELVEV